MSLILFISDPNSFLLIFKENWELFSDEKKLDEYISTKQLVEKQQLLAQKQAELDALTADIENER